MIFAVLNPAERKITFASAGHLPPLLAEASGARFLNADTGLPLGIMECEFSEHEIEMPPGSRNFLYSDAMTEAINSALEKYGAGPILEHVPNHRATGVLTRRHSDWVLY